MLQKGCVEVLLCSWISEHSEGQAQLQIKIHCPSWVRTLSLREGQDDLLVTQPE